MSITILIVDDNEDIRFTLKEICDYAGWNSIEISTGKAAVEQSESVIPDLILLDYHMPDWDGLKTTKELRKRNNRAPIIILTVDGRQEIADVFLRAGANDFALKPIKAPDLISRIRINLKIAKLTGNNEDVFVEKGISYSTLRSIKDSLLRQSEPSSIQELQEELPISYQTVHRYLNYLEGKGEVEIISQYGKQGRPKNKYKLL
ncbi:MAG TPA: response regulator [Lentibacillus sp.]|uniref:response regulator n=1 Tax=Lentibacillus sp. TaxID=1925746 RepID=UPI002B4AEA1D|nr:response regulator [Lentibacillus sp.]HLR61265.1 response regulator [Lentibacillus sp.]